MARTWCPCSNNAGTSVVPMYPPAPVTNTFAIGVPFSRKIILQFTEPWLLAVLFRQNGLPLLDRPGNFHAPVVPHQPPVIPRRIAIPHLLNPFPISFHLPASIPPPHPPHQ